MIIYKQNMAFSNVLCDELKPVPRIQRWDEEVKKYRIDLYKTCEVEDSSLAVRNILHQ